MPRTLLLHYYSYAAPADLQGQADLHRALIAVIGQSDVSACNRIAGEMIAAILPVIRASLEPKIADLVDTWPALLISEHGPQGDRS